MNAEAIVIGVGGVGSAALWALARRGVRAVGIDRFGPGNDRGSSHGRTRVIRKAYFEHPAYVPLAIAAYERWREIEALTGSPLLETTGILQVGPPTGPVIAGVLESAEKHGLRVEALSADALERRYPHLRAPGEMAAVLEADGGLLAVEACVRACAQLARGAGARVVLDTVLGWRRADGVFEVRTAETTYRAPHLLVAGGAWSRELLDPYLEALDLQVRRKVQVWFDAPDSHRAEEGFPVFLHELPEGVFYGTPRWGTVRLKVAEHSGGGLVEDPLEVDRQLHPADVERLVSFVKSYLPGVDPRPRAHSVCLYTMSPDEHFIIGDGNVAGLAFAAGLSGHGFKFAPVLGEALADLALEGKSDHCIAAFAPVRPGAW